MIFFLGLSNHRQTRVKPHNCWTRWVCAALAFLALTTFYEHSSMAGLVLTNSSITVTFIGDTDDAANSTYNGGGLGDTLSYSQTYQGGLASANVEANDITSSNEAGWEMQVGSGLSRNDPNDLIKGATTLLVSFSATWKVVDTPFGGGLVNYANWTAGANLDAGDSAKFVNDWTYPDAFHYLGTLNFTTTGIQSLYYEGASTVPIYGVGATFSMHGSAFFSWSGNSIGDLVLVQTSGTSPVPEPTSWTLVGMGCLALVGFGRRRCRSVGKDQ